MGERYCKLNNLYCFFKIKALKIITEQLNESLIKLSPKRLERLHLDLESQDPRVKARARWILRHPDKRLAGENIYHYGSADVAPIDNRPTILYKAANLVNGKIYIGITSKTLRSRVNGHFTSASNGAPYPFSCAIRKYGKDNFSFATLAVFPNYRFAQQMEIAAIAAFKPEYNATLGGEGALGYRHPPEVLARIADAHRGKPSSLKGKKRPQETIDKIKKAKEGKPPTKFWLGKSRSAETKLKISNTKKGCAPPPLTDLLRETRARNCRVAAANRRKPVLCVTDGKVFESARDASVFYGFHPTSVAPVCSGKVKTCHGKEFRYV